MKTANMFTSVGFMEGFEQSYRERQIHTQGKGVPFIFVR